MFKKVHHPYSLADSLQFSEIEALSDYNVWNRIGQTQRFDWSGFLHFTFSAVLSS